jgi:radical SAM protein with 4Fe4S-binding SPASM domain
MVFHKQNHHCVSAVAELAAGIGAGVAFNPLRPLGRATPIMMLTPEEHQRLVTEVVGLRAKYPGMRIDTPWDYLAGPPGPPICTPFKRLGCGQSSLSVTPEGQCYACGQLSTDPRLSVGNVRSSDLAEIWSRSRAACLMVNAALPRECRACPYLDRSECFGGCAATALAVRGALDAGDPYCFVKLAAGGLR